MAYEEPHTTRGNKNTSEGRERRAMRDGRGRRAAEGGEGNKQQHNNKGGGKFQRRGNKSGNNATKLDALNVHYTTKRSTSANGRGRTPATQDTNEATQGTYRPHN